MKEKSKNKEYIRKIIDLIKQNKIKFWPPLLLFALFLVVFNYQVDKKECLQNIYYRDSHESYVIETESGFARRNNKVAVFKTKEDAMEYCLAFIE